MLQVARQAPQVQEEWQQVPVLCTRPRDGVLAAAGQARETGREGFRVTSDVSGWCEV